MSAGCLRKLPNFAIDCIRHFSFLVFSLTIALSPCVLRAEESTAQIYFYQALKLKQEGRILTAERLLKKAIDLEPQNPNFHFELGNLYIEHNDPVSARMELEETVMISPNHLPAHYNLGLVYRELGLMGEARDEFQRILEFDPANVKAQLQIGYTYQEEGFLEEARLAFERAREMDFMDPEPVRALGDLAQMERNARAGSANAMERSPAPGLWQTEPVQPQSSEKEALLQTGVVLLQQFLNRRSQSADPSESSAGAS